MSALFDFSGMLVGLFVQLIFFGLFLYVSASFLFRLRRRAFDLVEGPWRCLLYILFLVSALIIARCIFQIAEYAGGTDGYIASHEAMVYVFDVVPMLFVQAIFHFYHPGKVLVRQKLPEDAYVNLTDMR